MGAMIFGLMQELASYWDDHCEISTSEVHYTDGGVIWGGKVVGGEVIPPDGELNPGESFSFDVTVKNKGPLELKHVLLLIEKTSFATIFYESPADNPEAVSPQQYMFDVKANGSHSIKVSGRATAATNGKQTIARVRLVSWTAGIEGRFDGKEIVSVSRDIDARKK